MAQRSRTILVATRGVKEYRATIPVCVAEDDAVLEVGCEWGTTTAMIAERTDSVVGVDVGEDCIKRARKDHPGIRFEAVDAFDLRVLLGLGMDFTVIYVDLSGFSGYASLLDLLSLLDMYTLTFRPRVIVAKSSALKRLASRCVPWRDGVETLNDLLPHRR